MARSLDWYTLTASTGQVVQTDLPDARSAIGASPAYLAALVAETGCTVRELSARIGVSERQMHRWLSGDSKAPYTAVYALERLALASANPELGSRAEFIRGDYLRV